MIRDELTRLLKRKKKKPPLRAFIPDSPWYHLVYNLVPRLQLRLRPGRYAHLAPALNARGLSTLSENALLYRLARRVRCGKIVEIGSHQGRSTIALSLGSQEGHQAPVVAVDPHDSFTSMFGKRFGGDNRRRFLRNVAAAGVSHLVTLINQTSVSASRRWRDKIGLLFIDGDHRYPAVRKDFERWEPYVIRDGWIALHDTAEPSYGPRKVVNEALANGRFELVEETDGFHAVTHRACGLTVLRKQA